jgi:Spy/CpxP family protein refolding chaperone
MKRLLVVAFALSLLSVGAQGQASATQGAMEAARGNLRWTARQLHLAPAEIKAIGDIADRQVDGIEKAASEMRIIQARLERLLLDKNPDMGAIKQLVKSSLDWELQIRMARIERAIELRKMLGPERWAILQRLQRDYLQEKRSGRLRSADLGDNGEALAALLDRLE